MAEDHPVAPGFVQKLCRGTSGLHPGEEQRGCPIVRVCHNAGWLADSLGHDGHCYPVKHNMKHAHMGGIGLAAALALAAATVAADAADVTMNGSDSGSETSFNTGLHWAGGEAPGPGTNYFTGTNTLQGSTTANLTFAGDTLQVDSNGTFILQANTYVTSCSFTLAGGTLAATGAGTYNLSHSTKSGAVQGVDYLTTLAGNVVLDSRGSGTLGLYSELVGSGGVTIRGNVMYGATPINGYHHYNKYQGDTTVEAGATLGEFYCHVPYGTGKGNMIVNGTFNAFRNENINGLSGGGQVTQGDGNHAVTIGYGDADGDFSGTISSAGKALIKIGTGTQVFRGTNTYPCLTAVSNGVLSVSVLANGGVGSGIGQSGSAAGNLFLGGGTLRYIGGTQVIDRNFTVSSGTTGTVDVSVETTTLTITGGSTNTTGALIKAGAGTLALEGTNLHTGATTVNAGRLKLGATGTIASTNITVNAGGVLDVTAKTVYTNLASQTYVFGIDPAGAGSAGRIDATGSGLDISQARVIVNVAGMADDYRYVLADYGTLVGSEFAATSGIPVGYQIDYAYRGGKQIVLKRPSPGTVIMLQ